ncbi:hypothetical protein [Prosthecobacter sp.]|uniref:hypothetical protein n=1 Tax=Prosthecobacter sp. TaxID=1965333 RepID=UPI0024875BE7|nr:hypothetical protein [Prosthecobacter sp.]MDI1313230.1 hypothetical protein [Prosthecobacter sp.]
MDPEKVIQRLLKQTQQGEINWTRVSAESRFPYLTQATNDVVDVVFTAEVNGRNLALYEERYKAYTDEDSFYWTARRCMDVVSPKGEKLWQFPTSAYLNDLLDAAAYKSADVPNILMDLMGD